MTLRTCVVTVACTVALAEPALAQSPAGPQDVVQALRGGTPVEALRLLDAHLQRAPRDPVLLTLKGIALGALGRVDEGIRAYDAALAVHPDFPAALQGAAELEYRAKRPGARKRLERILVLDPANAVAHAMLAALAYERQDCTTALRHFTDAMTVVRGNPTAMWQFGHCLFAEDRPAEAAALFEQLLAVEGSDQRAADAARFNLALALHEAGRHAESLAALGPLVSRPVPEREVLSLAADAHAASQQIAQAVDTLRRATKLYPLDEQFYITLAALCLEHDSLDLALEIAEIGLRNVPRSSRLYALRGIVQAQLGAFDRALADFERVGEMEPQESAAVAGLSLTLQQTGRLEQSVALLRKQARERPDDPLANLLLGQALMRGAPGDEELDEARAALLRAVSAQPRLAPARIELGKVYLQTGDVEKAVDQLRQAVEIDPSDKTATYQLLVALRRAGRQAEAQQLVERVRQLLDEERAAEIERNRFRLIKGEPEGAPRR